MRSVAPMRLVRSSGVVARSRWRGRPSGLAQLVALALLATWAWPLASDFSDVSGPISAVTRYFDREGRAQRHITARDAALSLSGHTNADGIPMAGDQLVYGEFDLEFFARLLAAAKPKAGDNFFDVGSGVGRIVIAASLLQPTLGNACGLEVLPALHLEAEEASRSLVYTPLMRAPLQFACLDIYSERAGDMLSFADIVFSYSVTWARDDQNRLTELSRLLAQKVRPGTRVIVVDVTLLPKVANIRFDRTASIKGYNEETGEKIGHVFVAVDDSS
mmetsp:Transcript_29801/g.40135  ORF Transcript_29801/g.40135 Transcript_29801/m.40135 type:complete len:275 (-) Transcript_29801:111-935(-)